MSEERSVIARLENIVKIFPGVRALDGVSFDVRAGEVHALCGENGAGKSTLIKVMTGAHRADGGQYFLDGRQVEFKSAHEGISAGVSCVYQELSIAPQLSVAQNLYIGQLPMVGPFINYQALYAGTREILNTLGLNVSPRTLAGELSVGQQQMIEIGRALTRNARIIIMDEPTSSLSEKETDTLFELILRLKEQGVSIIYISHKLDEVMYLADRITVIRDGRNVVTMDKNETDQAQLIAHMIGRSMENLYNKTPAEVGDTILQVRGLGRTGVFEGIDFEARKGEILGFFGLVGAGRSEIMRAVFGIDKYQTGTVTVAGKKLKGGDPVAAIEAGIGFCTEDRKSEGLMLKLSVLQNMTLVKLKDLAHAGVIDRKKQKELADSYVEGIHIKTPSTDQLAGNLSGGNQQKTVLAKWLMMQPQVLIVDEPTRGIDVGSKAEIYGLLSKLAGQGVAIIIVSSEIEEIIGVCDRVITVFEGRITANMPTGEASREKILAASIGKADIMEDLAGDAHG